MYAKRTARRLYSALVCPQVCLLCGSLSVQGLPVCQPCIERFFLPYIADFHSDRQSNHPRCRRCGKILVSEHDLCTRCRAIAETGAPEQKNTHARIFSLFPYIGLGQKLVPVWKNNNVRTFFCSIRSVNPAIPYAKFRACRHSGGSRAATASKAAGKRLGSGRRPRTGAICLSSNEDLPLPKAAGRDTAKKTFKDGTGGKSSGKDTCFCKKHP